MKDDLTPELGKRRRPAWGAYKSIEDVVKKTRSTRRTLAAGHPPSKDTWDDAVDVNYRDTRSRPEDTSMGPTHWLDVRLALLAQRKLLALHDAYW
ncbi:hypothetical protein RB195_020255 [Necator americanus]|uniref:Uncharacterized protein n=1 Tax=Necator americanus TaxID=51031 RepID=A0ABR1CHY3_NECAM